MLWLCGSAIWIASSSVMLVGPVLWANAGLASAHDRSAARTALPRTFRKRPKLFKGCLRFWKLIAISRDPDIKRRQQNNAQEHGGNQAAHDNNCEGPLRVGSDFMRQGCRQESESCHQHGHHDGTKPQNRAFDRGIYNRVASRTELVNVFEHDDSRLYRHAEQCQHAHT